MAFKRDKEDERNDRRSPASQKATGSTYSYRSSRSVREGGTARYTRAEQEVKSVDDRTKLIKNAPFYIGIIIIVALLIYSVMLTPSVKVKVVDNTSNSFLQPLDVYQKAADKILQSSYLNGNKLTIDADSVANKITQEFPELNSATLVVPLSGRQPILEVRPARSVVVLSNAQGKYMINQNGAAMLKLDTAQKLQQYPLPQVTDDSGLAVTLGNKVIPVASITFINAVIQQFNAKSIPIQSMTLVQTPYELDVQVRGEPYVIKFNLLADPNYSIGTYLATVKQLAQLKQTPSQYIDVRIAGRAYYK